MATIVPPTIVPPTIVPPTIVLRIVIEDDNLRNLYTQHVLNHNEAVATSTHPNAGFDLFVPQTQVLRPSFNTSRMNFGVKTEMVYISENGVNTPTGFFIMPRSSLSNTPLMLSNHVGVVDSGYRGDLIGAFRNLSTEAYVVEEGTRLLQVCHPTLTPFRVEILSSVNDLTTTTRGAGAFGSTGR
jgi:dUTP pyrophosphatase